MPEDGNEISLGDISKGIKKRIRYLLSKWVILLVAAVIGIAVGLLYAYTAKPKYTGKLIFVLSTESKGSNLSGLASQFGLDFGGGSSNDVFSGDNILTLFKSQKMIKSVLFKKPPNESANLANIIVQEWEWDKQWRKHDRTNTSFPFPDDPAKLTLVQDSLLREIHTKLIEQYVLVSRTDKKLSVFELKTTVTNEVFACYLTRYLMDETAKFYIETKTSIAKKNLVMLEKEADSLRSLLGRNITATAASIDQTFNLNSALQIKRSSAQKSQANATVVATAYGEVIKNLEIAKITLQKEMPLYQIIDTPQIPLKAERVSKLFSVLTGFIFVFACSLFLVFRKNFSRDKV